MSFSVTTKNNMKTLLQTIRWPLLIEIANALLVQLLPTSTTALLVISWAITISIIFWGGWLVLKENWGTLLRAASVGPIILIFGFTLIGGLYNLVTGDFSNIKTTSMKDINPRILYLGGVVVSTLMVVPVVALISLFGGVLSRKHFNKSKTTAL
jgi:hypothetical protein